MKNNKITPETHDVRDTHTARLKVLPDEQTPCQAAEDWIRLGTAPLCNPLTVYRGFHLGFLSKGEPPQSSVGMGGYNRIYTVGYKK